MKIEPINRIKPFDLRCTHCERPLKREFAWLELNNRIGKYTDPDVAPWPDAESQGYFPFGVACAKRLLKEQER